MLGLGPRDPDRLIVDAEADFIRLKELLPGGAREPPGAAKEDPGAFLNKTPT